MLNKLKGLIREEEGQGLTEYGLVLGVIAVAAVGTIYLFRNEIISIYQQALDNVQSRPSDTPSIT